MCQALSPLILTIADPPAKCSVTLPRLHRKSVAQAGFEPRSGCSQVSYSFHYAQCGCGLDECPLTSACLPSGLCPNTSGCSGFSKLEPTPLGRDWSCVDGVIEAKFGVGSQLVSHSVPAMWLSAI